MSVEFLDRRGSDCIKYDHLDLFFNVDKKEDILPLWVADMDFATPDYIVKQIKKRVEHPIYGYSITDFSNSVIKWQERFNFQVEKKHIVPISSVVAGINISLLAFTTKSDKIALSSPIYPPFLDSIKHNERILADNPLIKEENYFIDIEGFDPLAKVLLLCNPHNPVGRVWTRNELIKIGEYCLKNSIIIVTDEVHSDLTYEGFDHCPIASIRPEFADITITLNSAAKTFNISGLGGAYAIISNDRLRVKFKKYVSNFHMYPGLFSSIAIKAAYDHGESWPKELMKYILINRDYVINFIREKIPAIDIITPEATYLLWLDFSFFKLTHQELEEILINKAQLVLSSGKPFGKDKFFRLNLGTSLDNIKTATTRLEASLSKYSNK